MDELIYASASTLAKAIRTKQVSAQEVVAAHLARIAAVNPRLNAVVQVTAESALAAARAADAALARGELKGPLHGVPFTVKDSLDTAGVITTGGTQGRRNFVPSQDATVVARLRHSGAILLGKTNTPELTLFIETDNLVYGRTNNPYDLTRSPSGSSGGAAAIIAAGGSPLDLGSDTGGSIRQPAHYCGIAGLKPTAGRIPRTGHIIAYEAGPLDILTQLGPLARFVEDLILVLPLIAGVDWRDPAVVPMPLADPAAVKLKGLRVAFFTDNGIAASTPEVAATVQAAAAALAAAGAQVTEARPPEIENTRDTWFELVTADGAAWIERLLKEAGTTEVYPALRDRFLGRESLSAAELSRMLSRLDRLRSVMLAFMEHYEIILCPVSAYPALPHGATADLNAGFTYSRVFNLTGWPAAVVRGGSSPEGLPIGVQIVARPWGEAVALAVAHHLETVLGGWSPPPL